MPNAQLSPNHELATASVSDNGGAGTAEASSAKYRVLFIHPGPVPPNKDPRKNLYFHISTVSEGDLVATIWGRRENYGTRPLAEQFDTLGSFRYHATLSVDMPGPLKFFWDLGYYLRVGLGLSKSQGAFDAIVTYGPFKCSIAGWIISRLTGSKLIIEVPGPPTDGFLFERGLWAKIKLHVARGVRSLLAPPRLRACASTTRVSLTACPAGSFLPHSFFLISCRFPSSNRWMKCGSTATGGISCFWGSHLPGKESMY